MESQNEVTVHEALVKVGRGVPMGYATLLIVIL
jgi:hypothetical protein